MLLAANHRVDDIGNYTLSQFTIYLHAAERREASRRSSFVTDLGAVVGGLFGGGDSLTKHLNSLLAIENEEISNGSSK